MKQEQQELVEETYDRQQISTEIYRMRHPKLPKASSISYCYSSLRPNERIYIKH